MNASLHLGDEKTAREASAHPTVTVDQEAHVPRSSITQSVNHAYLEVETPALAGRKKTAFNYVPDRMHMQRTLLLNLGENKL